MKSILFSGTVCLVLTSALHAQSPLTLWPSDFCDVRQHSDSKAEVQKDKTVFVKTGTSYSWPGATVYFKDGVRDLAAYGTICVTVSNLTAESFSVHLSVKNKNQKGNSPGGSTSALAPHGIGEIRTSLRNSPWVLDKPLELVGMRGFPAAIDGGTFNVRETAELHVFLAQPDKPAAFAITKIEVFPQPITYLKSDTFLPFVDKFGQFIHTDWPGKIHSDEEFRKACEREEKWLAANANGPATDRNAWGGWTKGPQLKATGHFRTEKVNGAWWFVDPDGRLFFSHGVDCVGPNSNTGVTRRENYFAWLPPEKDSPFSAFYGKSWWAPHGFYKDKGEFKTFDFATANLYRKYGDAWRDAYAETAHRRIRAWGLNTIANWSDGRVYNLRRTPYTVCLGTSGPRIEGSEGWWGKFPDPYAKEFIDHIQKRAREQQKSGNATDPWCIGYFVDNELSWGSDDRSLALAAVLSPATQPAKLAFKGWLTQKYETVQKLNTAWGTNHASWDAFLANTEKPDMKRCGNDLEAFHTQIAEQYFRVIRDALKAAAPDKLYLGCRIAWGAPSVYRASAKYCDVVSVNIYQRQVTRDLPEGADDKPMINGEFHFGALDRGMFHTGLVAVKDQKERAECYVKYVTSCLQHPRFIGTHWFQWKDQALTGRGDEENYQIGFLTILDQPYPELVEATRSIGRKMYTIRHTQATKR